MAEAPDPSDTSAFRKYVNSFPYDKRWEALRPVLEPLFHTESIKDIAKMMLDRYQFKASEVQYKYRFNKVWKLQKNFPEPVKAAAVRKCLQRARHGKESIAKYNGRVIPASRIRTAHILPTQISSLNLRQLFTFPLDELAIFGRYTPFGNNILLAWNAPYGVRLHHPDVHSPSYNESSPSDVHMGNTPCELQMITPPANAPSPQDMLVPQSDPANLSLVLREQRTKLFLEGKFADLLDTLNGSEITLISQYLFDFWHFSFSSAQSWTPYSSKIVDNLEHTVPDTDEFQRSRQSSQSQFPEDSPQHLSTMPSKACGWAIHLVDPNDVLDIPQLSDSLPPRENADSQEVDKFQDGLRTALATGSFTRLSSVDLAVPLSELASKVSRSQNDLRAEAISFAIMGRNFDLLTKSLDKVYQIIVAVSRQDRAQYVLNMGLDWTSLLHIATSYLDGGNVCCLIIAELAKSAIVFEKPWTRNLVNSNGHTLVDNLLLTILRSHAEVSLNTVDSKLGKLARYSGQEVDICGRWDATSPCFRALLDSGQTQIPQSWKHKFCRTSAQVICHASALLLYDFPILRTQESGLFSQRCVNVMCGKLLTFRPLHALVMTGFYLVRFGNDEEDLFGILAYFLCMINLGFDPLLTIETSVLQVLGVATTDECDHEVLTAAGLASRIQKELHHWQLSEVNLTGFASLLSVMQEAETSRRHHDDELEQGLQESNEYEESDTEYSSPEIPFSASCEEGFCELYRQSDSLGSPSFGKSWKLGHVWAEVQAEMASAQLRDRVSGSFDMKRLLRTMTDDIVPDLPHLESGVLREYCSCGRFIGTDHGRANMDEIFKEPSGNLSVGAEIWARISIIQPMELD